MQARIKELDGLRGIAVLSVVYSHYLGWVPYTGAGVSSLGVDLFFVLSGFLISSNLLELRAKEHYFKVFYSRRCLRILPPYCLGLLVYLAASIAMKEPGTPGLWLRYIFFYTSLWVHNFRPLAGGPLGVPVFVAAGLSVLWSLSVEEIYYTIWAPIVRFTNEFGFTAILLIMIVGAPFLRWWMHEPDLFDLFTFYCRMDGLAYGSAIALLARHRRNFPQAWQRADRVFHRLTKLMVLFALVFFLILSAHLSLRWYGVLSITVADVSFALVTFTLVRRAGGSEVWVRAFRVRWLCSIGLVSYSLYLFHLPILTLCLELPPKLHFSGPVSYASAAGLALVLSLALVYALWYGMESRILRWKNRAVPVATHI